MRPLNKKMAVSRKELEAKVADLNRRIASKTNDGFLRISADGNSIEAISSQDGSVVKTYTINEVIFGKPELG
jgi:hypothetical protein